MTENTTNISIPYRQGFVCQYLCEAGIPFKRKLEHPNKETLADMLEAEMIKKDPSVKGCNILNELLNDLGQY